MVKNGGAAGGVDGPSFREQKLVGRWFVKKGKMDIEFIHCVYELDGVV